MGRGIDQYNGTIFKTQMVKLYYVGVCVSAQCIGNRASQPKEDCPSLPHSLEHNNLNVVTIIIYLYVYT